MKIQQIKYKNSTDKYSILIGNNILSILANKIKELCPMSNKIALIVDTNVPKKFIYVLKKNLKNFNVTILAFKADEKNKSIKTVSLLIEKLLLKNFNRSDLIVSIGGGITGDVTGFVSSIYKRGINFINIPTTLLAQVDSAIGGKTGVNSIYGKNLIGSFFQPKLVIIDTKFLESLPKKEMVCGYAEILKHSIINNRNFFNWLKKNTKFLINKNYKKLIYAIKKSCKIKMSYINKDVNEKNLRMILNFGHTFAHAIEAKNNFSKKISHGEAVLSGMILATRLSVIKNVCNPKVLREIEKIYYENNLGYTIKRFSSRNKIKTIIPYLKNDKKNNDNKINFILLKNIGKTTLPNKFKMSLENVRKLSNSISQY